MNNKKRYSWLDFSVTPNFDKISQKKSVLVHQISGLIFNNTDILLLTLFTDLKIVSIYTIYNTLFNVIKTGTSYISNGVVFILGQTFHNNKVKFIKLFEIYELYYLTFVFAVSTVTNIFIIPFLTLYTKGITDVNYINKYLPILFTIIILLLAGRVSSRQVIDIAGHFNKTQNRSIMESAINIVASILLVNYIGIYGVLLGTIAALLYRTNDMIIYSNKVILNRSPFITYRNWMINLLLFIAISSVASVIKITFNTYTQIIVWSLVYFFFVLIIFLSVLSIMNLKTARNAYNFIKEKQKQTSK